MTAQFRMGMLIHKMVLTLDNTNLNKVKGYIQELEEAIIDEFGGRWTYCEDEQPHKDDTYLVLWNDETSNRKYYALQNYYEGEGWDVDIPQAKGKVNIIAWQELPDAPEA